MHLPTYVLALLLVVCLSDEHRHTLVRLRSRKEVTLNRKSRLASTTEELHSTRQFKGKYTFEKCVPGSQSCVYPRECNENDDHTAACTSESFRCECYFPIDPPLSVFRTCKSSVNCLFGDRCYEYIRTDLGAFFCITCNIDDPGVSDPEKWRPVDTAEGNCPQNLLNPSLSSSPSASTYASNTATTSPIVTPHIFEYPSPSPSITASTFPTSTKRGSESEIPSPSTTATSYLKNSVTPSQTVTSNQNDVHIPDPTSSPINEGGGTPIALITISSVGGTLFLILVMFAALGVRKCLRGEQ